MSEKLKNGWIDIDEQLPVHGQEVLVILRENNILLACNYRHTVFRNGLMFYVNGVMGVAYFAEDIRYWQPGPSKEVR